MNKHDRELKDLLQSIREGLTGPGLCSIADRQYKRLFSSRPRPTRPSPESVRVHEEVKGREEEATRERCRVEYEAVKERAGGRCELTGVAGSLVIHHVFYGRGVDRDEVTDRELMVCVADSIHKQIHRRPTFWEWEMKRWASEYGFTRAWNEIERRAEHARAVQENR